MSLPGCAYGATVDGVPTANKSMDWRFEGHSGDAIAVWPVVRSNWPQAGHEGQLGKLEIRNLQWMWSGGNHA